MGEVLEGFQRGRVVLAQRTAQRVGLPGTRPDQTLVGAGQHLDRLRIGAVAGDPAMVVSVGAHQIGQQFGIAGVGFGARDVVAVAVAGHRHRIDRKHLIARRAQRRHPQATVGFNADRRLVGFVGMLGDQLVQLPDTSQPLRQPARRQTVPGLIHHIKVVMVLGPVIPDENHPFPPRFPTQLVEPPRTPGGGLMDQCSTGTTSHKRYR